MAYQCNLDAGQQIIIDNQGEQTAITLTSSGSGQQQSQRTSFTTGIWTSPPVLFRTSTGLVLQLT
ncbi:MAG: zinc ribbon domain-containing protein, partial [Cyanobacteriota bacterium]